MLARHMVGYAPSLIVTAILSLASLSFLTHFLSHAEYGQYSLAISMMTMLIGICFLWFQNATTRLMPLAVIDGSEEKLSATLYCIFGLTSAVVLAIFALIALTVPLGDWRVAVIFAPLLAVLRSLLSLNQAFHRNFVRITHYNVIEIGQAVIGLALAILLIKLLHHGASEAITGMVIGFIVMAVFDWRMLSKLSWQNFDREKCKEILHFGLPFIANFAFSFILSGSDRFLIEFFLGPEQVGLYSAGYAFPDRIGQYLFMAVATASFPLIVRRLEQEGVEAARDQTYTNAVAMLTLAMPACAGMLLADRQIAAVLIGSDFRASAVNIIPWIAVATMFNGFAAHYFDHAFLLAKKTRFFFLTLGPAALLNLVANLYVIPHYGIIGAAYTTLASYALYLTLSIILGRLVFLIKFPFKPAGLIFVSVAIMAFVISAFNFPETIAGLIAMVICGAAVYTLACLTFDIMGTRSFLESWWQQKTRQRELKKTDFHFEILCTFSQIEKIKSEWIELHTRSKATIFGSYSWFQIWWRHIGISKEFVLYFVVARSETGELVALLPCVIRRIGLLRILEWVGYEVFDYGDVLAINDSAAYAIWDFVCRDKTYDIALIKDLHATARSFPIVSSRMRLREQKTNYFLTLDFSSGEDWLAAQSRKLRGDVRRKGDKLQAQGAVTFHVYRHGDILPNAVIDALYMQKLDWFKHRRAHGVFIKPAMKEFLHDFAKNIAEHGHLYLAWLSCNDRIVACHIGFVCSGTLYLYHTTYDLTFAAFSPGNLLMVETIKNAIDSGFHELDFMRGDETYKQRFASGMRPLTTFIAGYTWLGRSLVSLSLRMGNRKVLINDHDSEED